MPDTQQLIAQIPDDTTTMRRVLLTPPPPDLEPVVRTRALMIAGELGPQNRGALVSIATTKGVNLALVTRAGPHFFVTGYIAKEWGKPLEAGGQVEVKW